MYFLNDEITVVWGLGQNESHVSPEKSILLAQVSVTLNASELLFSTVIGNDCRASSLDYCNCMRKRFYPAALYIHLSKTNVSHLLLCIGGIQHNLLYCHCAGRILHLYTTGIQLGSNYRRLVWGSENLLHLHRDLEPSF